MTRTICPLSTGASSASRPVSSSSRQETLILDTIAAEVLSQLPARTEESTTSSLRD
ncbi:hypothetical protein FOXG_17704 [Fusarium oxysporum f. sp. lycopersici 4287]|uniref:Uncharacterized protein n=1 Tax=Fusarium oxysporum f. sp. lycopersici (strain 4287 / CBS 123668 / FGSC 9935 / NRRL 34936) TaxID=426428 RepID=A0A0J9WW75_FUSO4|nr:uncharacterized protein FOXG_17704 [Fusarium oxysporum f. sp. lycopersici 4287]KNB20792.1 hypothetical protein FOXG_17704 [Fusarium oxysporum f. sp. lycopersici 4287]